MSTTRKATDDQLIESYGRLGSVWKVATAHNMCGQSVHERLAKIGAIHRMNVFTDSDDWKLLNEYEDHADSGRLADLAASMGRDKTTICGRAQELGLTKRSRSRAYLSETLSKKMRAWHADNDHPCGFTGKTQTKRGKARISASAKAHWARLTVNAKADLTLHMMKMKVAKRGKLAVERSRGSWKAAWAEVGGKRCFFRSQWEANYARYLEWLKSRHEIVDWDHEPETFWFEKIKRGVRSFLPDFKVIEKNGEIVYHEVKGWMDPQSKTKIRRMKRYHPSIRLIVIDTRAYKAIKAKVGALVPGWAGK